MTDTPTAASPDANRLGRSVAARFGRRQSTASRGAYAIGDVATRSVRFGVMTGRSILARRALGDVVPVRSGSIELLPVGMPALLWAAIAERARFRPSPGPDERFLRLSRSFELTGRPPTGLAAGPLPPRGLPRATARRHVSRVGADTGPAAGPHRLVGEAAFVGGPAEVRAAGPMLGERDRGRAVHRAGSGSRAAATPPASWRPPAGRATAPAPSRPSLRPLPLPAPPTGASQAVEAARAAEAERAAEVARAAQAAEITRAGDTSRAAEDAQAEDLARADEAAAAEQAALDAEAASVADGVSSSALAAPLAYAAAASGPVPMLLAPGEAGRRAVASFEASFVRAGQPLLVANRSVVHGRLRRQAAALAAPIAAPVGFSSVPLGAPPRVATTTMVAPSPAMGTRPVDRFPGAVASAARHAPLSSDARREPRRAGLRSATAAGAAPVDVGVARRAMAASPAPTWSAGRATAPPSASQGLAVAPSRSLSAPPFALPRGTNAGTAPTPAVGVPAASTFSAPGAPGAQPSTPASRGLAALGPAGRPAPVDAPIATHPMVGLAPALPGVVMRAIMAERIAAASTVGALSASRGATFDAPSRRARIARALPGAVGDVVSLPRPNAYRPPTAGLRRAPMAPAAHTTAPHFGAAPQSLPVAMPAIPAARTASAPAAPAVLPAVAAVATAATAAPAAALSSPTNPVLEAIGGPNAPLLPRESVSRGLASGFAPATAATSSVLEAMRRPIPPLFPRVPVPLAARLTVPETPASRFLAAMAQAPADPVRPLAERFTPLARAVAGDRAVHVRTGPATSRALASVGKRAATVSGVVHLAAPPDLSPKSVEVLAHELVHAARPSPVPRFFDDDDHDHEERVARRTGSLMRSVRPPAVTPSAVAQRGGEAARNTYGTAGLPVGAGAGFINAISGATAASATTIRRAVAPEPPPPPPVSPPPSTSSAGGSSGGSGGSQVIRRSMDGPAPRSSNPTSRTTTIRRAMGTSSVGPTSPRAGGEPTPSDAPAQNEMMEQIIEAIEQRVLAELERRASRQRPGAF